MLNSSLEPLEWNRAFGSWLWQLCVLELGHGHSGWTAEDFDGSDGEHIRITWPDHGGFSWSVRADPVAAFAEFRGGRGLERTFPPPRTVRTPEDWWVELHREIASLPDLLADFGPIRYTRLRRGGDVGIVSITDGRVDEGIEYDLTAGFDPGLAIEIGETYIGRG